MVALIVGALFGFLFGTAVSGPKEKSVIASFFLGALFGMIVLVAGVPGWVGFVFGASIFVASTVAVYLPDDNVAKAFVNKALS